MLIVKRAAELHFVSFVWLFLPRQLLTGIIINTTVIIAIIFIYTATTITTTATTNSAITTTTTTRPTITRPTNALLMWPRFSTVIGTNDTVDCIWVFSYMLLLL